MERKLIEAAKKGDVLTLQNLIKGDPLALKATVVFEGDGPLHIACLGGYVGFVKELLSLDPELAAEVNQDGLSPLHIASANGNLEIVRELLKVGSHLCFVEGRYGRIPLHSAVCKGRKLVVRELLSSSLESVQEMTTRGENCFHLAIMNNQFKIFKELVDFVIRHEKGEILNNKDGRGNNIFHLAAYGKQYEVFDLLLDENFGYEDIVDEINSLNKNGLTPLDVLLSNDTCDREVEAMVRASGGKTLEETLSQQNSMAASNNPSPNQPQQQQISQPFRQSPSDKLLEYFKFNKLNASPSKVRATLLVLAVLIATATYQSVLSPPGGVWQDDFWPIANSTVKQPPRHSAGESVMGTNKPISYGLFLLFNSMGFFMSLQIIYLLTSGIRMQFEMRVSLFAMTVTYDTCMVAIAPDGIIRIFFVVVSILLPLIMPIVTIAWRNYGNVRRYSSVGTSSGSA
ncbi:ankyrin repeat-containing protein-like [Dorcoceras hygrometricum]|uniref:Ankyrin repeat-containing protein-like n=1 Tax=Dorcoceras hygrometricum TaxID=472368 RepID=A0A2Z7D476_9LAMI|nr:ankyrin repeat-containing protein-like [Dorcoceras hygrometricum]